MVDRNIKKKITYKAPPAATDLGNNPTSIASKKVKNKLK